GFNKDATATCNSTVLRSAWEFTHMSQRSRGDDSTIAGNLPAGADATAEAHPITDGLGRQARPKLHFFAVAVVVASASVASFAVAQESKLDALRGAAKASPADPN